MTAITIVIANVFSKSFNGTSNNLKLGMALEKMTKTVGGLVVSFGIARLVLCSQ